MTQPDTASDSSRARTRARLGVWLLVIITVVFFMLRAAPGNPYSAERMLTPAVEANLKASLGLDKPLHEQYFEYVGKVVQGDLGPSMVFYDKDVSELLGAGLPADYAEFLLTILGYFKAGDAERTTDAVQRITGRAPIAFEQYTHAHWH